MWHESTSLEYIRDRKSVVQDLSVVTKVFQVQRPEWAGSVQYAKVKQRNVAKNLMPEIESLKGRVAPRQPFAPNQSTLLVSRISARRGNTLSRLRGSIAWDIKNERDLMKKNGGKEALVHASEGHLGQSTNLPLLMTSKLVSS